MGECMTTHVPNLINFEDPLTKVIYESKRWRLVNGILFYIYEYDCIDMIDPWSASILDYNFDLEMTTLGGL